MISDEIIKKVNETVKPLSEELPDSMTILTIILDDGDIGMAGTGCPVCIALTLMGMFLSGKITHTSKILNEKAISPEPEAKM